jgi:hypothetical protein
MTLEWLHALAERRASRRARSGGTTAHDDADEGKLKREGETSYRIDNSERGSFCRMTRLSTCVSHISAKANKAEKTARSRGWEPDSAAAIELLNSSTKANVLPTNQGCRSSTQIV